MEKADGGLSLSIPPNYKLSMLSALFSFDAQLCDNVYVRKASTIETTKVLIWLIHDLLIAKETVLCHNWKYSSLIASLAIWIDFDAYQKV